MIKLTFCLIRKPELTREEFQKYWLDKHGPLVRSVGPKLRIKRYVQLHSATDLPGGSLNDAIRASRNAPEMYDGVAQLWWETLEELQAGMSSPEGQKAGALLLEDEKKFIDLARSPLWIGEEHEIIPPVQ